MNRRRQRYDIPILSSSSTLSQDKTNGSDTTRNEDEIIIKPKTLVPCSHPFRSLRRASFRQKVLLGFPFFLINILFAGPYLLDHTPLGRIIVYNNTKDPYKKAAILHPFKTLQARYLDTQNRPTSIKTFHMNNQTGFVLNLDRDGDRMRYFQSQNPDVLQRFAAHEWTMATTTHVKSQDKDYSNQTMVQIQQEYRSKYPFVKIASDKGVYGDAACFISHVRLWQEKLLDGSLDYVFVFEDDVRISEPLHSHNYVLAPDTADIVFLMPTALGLVPIPWKVEPFNVSQLVIGGYGAYGYIITRQGAMKMLQVLKYSTNPIDVAFFDSSLVRVYLPKRWPLVQHGVYKKGASSRRDANGNNKRT